MLRRKVNLHLLQIRQRMGQSSRVTIPLRFRRVPISRRAKGRTMRKSKGNMGFDYE